MQPVAHSPPLAVFPPRHVGLDAVRAVGMLLVIVGHSVGSFTVTPIGWLVQDAARSVVADFVAWTCHGFLMPLFFLLAGYFACHTLSQRGLAAFIRQRIHRLFVPFGVLLLPNSFVVNTLWDIGKQWMNGHRHSAPAALSLIRNTNVHITLAHLWYLYYLLAMSVVALCLAALCVSLPAPRRAQLRAAAAAAAHPVIVSLLLLFLATVVLAQAGKLQVDTVLGFAIDPWIFLLHGIFYAAGSLAYQRRDHFATVSRYAWPFSVLAIGCVLALLPYLVASTTPGAATVPPLWALLLSAGFSTYSVLALLALCLRFTTRERPFRTLLARSSFWSYLVHFPLVLIAQLAVWPLSLYGPVKFLFVIVFTIGTCVGTYRLLIANTRLRAWFG